MKFSKIFYDPNHIRELLHVVIIARYRRLDDRFGKSVAFISIRKHRYSLFINGRPSSLDDGNDMSNVDPVYQSLRRPTRFLSNSLITRLFSPN